MHRLIRLDSAIRSWAQKNAVTLVRVAIGVVFVWFGGLKIAGISPVEDLVANTLWWVPKRFVVPALGLWEVTVGVGLMTGFAIRVVIAMFMLLIAGTFFSAVVQPEVMIKGSNPLALTLEGEFLVKNLVLLAAGVVAAAAVPPVRSETSAAEFLLAGAVKNKQARVELRDRE